jgi:putative endopeptidase
MTDSQDIFECIPQNDLDCYYNLKWKELHKMSNNKPSLNNFIMIQDKIDKEIYKFIINAKIGNDPILNNLINLRNSYFNRNDNSEQIIILINIVQNITNISELAYAIRILFGLNISTFFTISLVPHFKEPDIYVLALGEISLTLEPKEIYDEDNNESAEFIKIYSEMLRDIYHFITKKWGYHMSKMKKFIRNVIIFEILFSKSNFSLKASMDPIITNNSMLYEKFIDQYDTGDFWKIILSEYMENDMYIFYENQISLMFIKKFLQKMTVDDLSMTKDYLIYCIVKKYGLYTSISSSFEKILSSEYDEKKIFVGLFYESFGYYLQSVYELSYSNSQKNNAVRDMFNEMKLYCLRVFENSNIFSNETKHEAIQKLQTIEIVIGKQAYEIDLLELPVLTNNFYDNLMMLHLFYFKKMISFVGQPKNRYYLSISGDIFSFMINAYYDPSSNIIYVPTSLVDDMFFKLGADPIYNYGSLGSIIGHEFMHCFDNNGALFDHNGHLHNWWTSSDYKKYNNEIIKVKNHYSKLMINGIQLDSDLSVSENIADITGIKLSLRTYIQKYMRNTDPKKLNLEEKEHLKKFFERWAQTLRTIENNGLTKYDVKLDVHSPNTIRVNAPFSHIDEYYQTYNVESRHFNYLAPNLRTKFLDI